MAKKVSDIMTELDISYQELKRNSDKLGIKVTGEEDSMEDRDAGRIISTINMLKGNDRPEAQSKKPKIKATPIISKPAPMAKREKEEAPKDAPAKEEAPKEEPKKEIEGLAQINIEDFAKVELRAAKVVACEPIKRAKKLLKLTLDDGTSTPRTVASGIAKWYKPEDLIGHTVIVVANLKPAVLCGVESQGMILAADAGEDDVRVVFVDGTPAGSKIR